MDKNDPQLALKKEQAKIRREFNFLKTTDNIQSDFALAQANEICDYLNRLLVAPFQAWEAFLYKSISINKEDFLYKFYLRENEYGVLEPDAERITELKLQDLANS